MRRRRGLCALALACALLAPHVRAADAPASDTPVPAGTPFYFIGMVYMSGRIEFRDAADKLFPNYWYEGKYGDVRGKMVFDPKDPQLAFSLQCTRLCQSGDGMALKILGEVMQPDRVPPVRFTATHLGPWQAASPAEKSGAFEKAPIRGELDVDGRKLKVQGLASIRYNTPKGGDLRGVHANALLGTSVNLRAEFTIKGQDLGLTKVAENEIRVTVHSRAYTEATILDNRKAKTLQEAGVKE